MKVTNELLTIKWRYRHLSSAVINFLSRYNKFLDERTIEANRDCNTAIERLREVVDNSNTFASC